MKVLLTATIALIGLFNCYAQNPEQKLKELGLTLPEYQKPVATYSSWRQVGNMLYIAGTTCRCELKGKVGKDLTIEQGKEAAKLAGLHVLATIKEAIGDLNQIKQFVRVTGMVNSSPDFSQHSQVINGFSDLMVEVFGEKGLHARAAVGQGSLPGNSPVEMIVTVELQN